MAGYLEDGGTLTGSGSGVIKALGGHRWRLTGVTLLSDGSSYAAESEMDLASRSLNGKIFEIT